MTTDRPPSDELATLLEKWCEQRLSADELALLERLVLSDPRAMQRYLDYVQLHGLLHWDAASAEGPSAGFPAGSERIRVRLRTAPVTADRIPVAGEDPVWKRQRTSSPTRQRIVLAVGGSLLSIAVAAFWLSRPQAPQQVVDQTIPVERIESPTENDEPESRSLPSVSLDRPASDAAPPDSTAEKLETASLTPPDEQNSQVDPAANSGNVGETDVVATIDQSLADIWEAVGVTPSPIADDGEWLRRASLDLTGRIPTLDMLAEFERNEDLDKRTKFINRVLSGEGFVQHFTTVWANQLVGRSEKTAHERHGIERFLADQFRENRPWNETVSELIAAEGSVRENGASGFLLAHLNNEAVPATTITARLFLGMQVQCTQCHKHPWNDWTQEQFWNLNAFFQQAAITTRSVEGQQEEERALVNEPVGGPTYFESRRGVMQATYPVFAGKTIDPGPETNRRRELAELLSSQNDVQLARSFVNRMWARFFKFGFTTPVDDMGPHNPPSHPELLEQLTREFIASGYDVKQLIRWITSSRAYQLSSRFGEDNEIDDPAAGETPLFSRMPVKSFTPEQVFNSLLVATDGEDQHADPIAIRDEREQWVQQFFEVLENEENSEISTFGESLTQALTMINGPLLSEALREEPGTVLHNVLTAHTDDEGRIRMLSRAALSRDPSPEELAKFRRIIGQAKSANREDPRTAVAEVLRDIYWAYLNSSEFVTNR